MQNWNSVAKIKTAILIVAAIVNLFNPFKQDQQLNIVSILSAFLFPLIFLPVLGLVKSKKTEQAPFKSKWNMSPFSDSIAASQFFAYLFIVVGICMIIGAEIRYKTFSSFALVSVLFGLGILLGNILSFLINRKSQ